jgi:hypothetical protein
MTFLRALHTFPVAEELRGRLHLLAAGLGAPFSVANDGVRTEGCGGFAWHAMEWSIYGMFANFFSNFFFFFFFLFLVLIAPIPRRPSLPSADPHKYHHVIRRLEVEAVERRLHARGVPLPDELSALI